MQALLRQCQRAADDAEDDRGDDLRGAGTVKIEGLKLADPREQFRVGEVAEDVYVELRPIGIQQRRDGSHRRGLEIPAVFQREQQSDQGREEEAGVNVGP